MSDIQILKPNLPSNNPEEISQVLIQKLREEWLDEAQIAHTLKDIINNAEVMNNKWDTIPDYNAKLQAVKTLYKMLTNKPDVQVNIANIFSWRDTF